MTASLIEMAVFEAVLLPNAQLTAWPCSTGLVGVRVDLSYRKGHTWYCTPDDAAVLADRLESVGHPKTAVFRQAWQTASKIKDAFR